MTGSILWSLPAPENFGYGVEDLRPFVDDLTLAIYGGTERVAVTPFQCFRARSLGLSNAALSSCLDFIRR